MKYLVITILAGFAVALFTYWLNKDKYDVDYILSEKIPTRFIEKDTLEKYESIQQITIRNNEEKHLNNLKINIKRNIIDFDIKKVALTDSIKYKKT